MSKKEKDFATHIGYWQDSLAYLKSGFMPLKFIEPDPHLACEFVLRLGDPIKTGVFEDSVTSGPCFVSHGKQYPANDETIYKPLPSNIEERWISSIKVAPKEGVEYLLRRAHIGITDPPFRGVFSFVKGDGLVGYFKRVADDICGVSISPSLQYRPVVLSDMATVLSDEWISCTKSQPKHLELCYFVLYHGMAIKTGVFHSEEQGPSYFLSDGFKYQTSIETSYRSFTSELEEKEPSGCQMNGWVMVGDELPKEGVSYHYMRIGDSVYNTGDCNMVSGMLVIMPYAVDSMIYIVKEDDPVIYKEVQDTKMPIFDPKSILDEVVKLGDHESDRKLFLMNIVSSIYKK